VDAPIAVDPVDSSAAEVTTRRSLDNYILSYLPGNVETSTEIAASAAEAERVTARAARADYCNYLINVCRGRRKVLLLNCLDRITILIIPA